MGESDLNSQIFNMMKFAFVVCCAALAALSQRLSQRLMLIPISCTEDMALAMPDITDMLDIHTPMDTMERDLLMLSQRLMLIPISMDMVLDTEPTDMDTHMPMVPMDTMERDL